jgi:hypothetical protein
VAIFYQHGLSLQKLLKFVKTYRFLDKKILSEVHLEDVVLLLKTDTAYVEAFKSSKPEELMLRSQDWQKVVRQLREPPLSTTALLLEALEERKLFEHALSVIDIFLVPYDDAVERLTLAHINVLMANCQFDAAAIFCLKLPNRCAQKDTLYNKAIYEQQKENMWLMIVNDNAKKLVQSHDKAHLEKLLNGILTELYERARRSPADRQSPDQIYLHVIHLMQLLYPDFPFTAVTSLERKIIYAFINTCLTQKSLTNPVLLHRIISISTFQSRVDKFYMHQCDQFQFDRLLACCEYLIRQIATYIQVEKNEIWKFIQELFPDKSSHELGNYLYLIYLMESNNDYLKTLLEMRSLGDVRLMSQVSTVLAEQLFTHCLYVGEGTMREGGIEKKSFFIGIPINNMESTAVKQACWAFRYIHAALVFVITTNLAVKARALDLYKQILAILSGKSFAAVDTPPPTLETPIIMSTEIFIEFAEYYLIEQPKLLSDLLKTNRLPLPSDFFQATPEVKIKELIAISKNGMYGSCIELAHVLEMQSQAFRHQQERTKDAETIKSLQEKLATFEAANRNPREERKEEREPANELAIICDQKNNDGSHRRTSSYPAFNFGMETPPIKRKDNQKISSTEIIFQKTCGSP